MKKSKLLVLGLIALVLAGGLVLASCNGDCCPKVTNGLGTCYSKSASSYHCGLDRCNAQKSDNNGLNGQSCNC